MIKKMLSNEFVKQKRKTKVLPRSRIRFLDYENEEEVSTIDEYKDRDDVFEEMIKVKQKTFFLFPARGRLENTDV